MENVMPCRKNNNYMSRRHHFFFPSPSSSISILATFISLRTCQEGSFRCLFLDIHWRRVGGLTEWIANWQLCDVKYSNGGTASPADTEWKRLVSVKANVKQSSLPPPLLMFMPYLNNHLQNNSFPCSDLVLASITLQLFFFCFVSIWHETTKMLSHAPTSRYFQSDLIQFKALSRGKPSASHFALASKFIARECFELMQ